MFVYYAISKGQYKEKNSIRLNKKYKQDNTLNNEYGSLAYFFFYYL